MAPTEKEMLPLSPEGEALRDKIVEFQNSVRDLILADNEKGSCNGEMVAVATTFTVAWVCRLVAWASHADVNEDAFALNQQIADLINEQSQKWLARDIERN